MEQYSSEEQNINSLPRIGEKAPDFTAQTTHGEISLQDYQGKWLVLFSHPSDFTPVCTTEFVGFQKIYETLLELNTELLGLSVDSVASHISWISDIERSFNTKIEFPVIADLNKKVANKYGMVMPESNDTSTSRAVFLIDPEGTVRAVIYYPLTTGRNSEEIIRLVKALQTTDKHGVSTPIDWEEGDKVIETPPSTMEEARERLNDNDYECKDWYFCKKELEY